MTDFLKAYGPSLIKNGYPICAINPGAKNPISKGWQKRSLTVEECGKFCSDTGVGIICGVGENPVCAIDLDSLDEEVSKRFEDTIAKKYPKLLEISRVGRAPKKLFVARAERPGLGKVVSGKFEKAGKDAIQLEILGSGQQFVAFGVHPDTKKEYFWDKWTDPTDVPALELPLVTEEQRFALIRIFEDIAESCGYSCRRHKQRREPAGGSGEFDLQKAYENSSRKLGLPPYKIRQCLGRSGIDGSRYDEWMATGCAIHYETSGSTEGLDIWDEWSAQFYNYKGREECETKWATMGNYSGQPKTMLSVISACKENQAGFVLWPLNTRGLAEEIFDSYEGKLLWSPNGEKSIWYKFDGAHWRKKDLAEMRAVVDSFVEKYLQELCRREDPEVSDRARKTWIKYKTDSGKGINRIISAMSALADYQVFSSDFDSDPRYLGLGNGDYDLEAGVFLDPDPRRLHLSYTGTEYDENAKCPKWERAVAECLGGESEAAHFQKLMGYVLTGANTLKQFYLLVGAGNNGKSMIVNVLMQVLGAYGRTMSADTIATLGKVVSNPSAPRADLVDLIGARFVVAQESAENAALQEEFVKLATGGDSLKVRGLYDKAMITFRPNWTLFLATNNLPEVSNPSSAVWNRIKVINFPTDFSEKGTMNVNLTSELLEEKSGILNWLLEGVRIWKEDAELADSPSVAKFTAQYKRQTDRLGDWLSESCEFGEELCTVRSAIRDNFVRWLKVNYGQSQSITVNKLTRELAEKGFSSVQKADGKRYYKGLALKDPLATNYT